MCYKQQDNIEVVTGTIDTTTTVVDDATTATAPANVVTTSVAEAATTNPGVWLCYLTPSSMPVAR